jgi:hypothetical protein
VAREAVVTTDSAPAPTPADGGARLGNPQLLFTLDEARNTPGGVALAPNGHRGWSVPNRADHSSPASLMEIDGATSKQPASRSPPTTRAKTPLE